MARMPLYDYDGTIIRRKNGYLACQMHARLEDMTEAEQGQAMKAAYWADYVTAAEWEALLGTGKAMRSNRSRLKRKGAGWLVALAHIADNWPEEFDAMVAQARTMHAEQMGRSYPWHRMAPVMAGIRRAVGGETVRVMLVDTDTDDDDGEVQDDDGEVT